MIGTCRLGTYEISFPFLFVSSDLGVHRSPTKVLKLHIHPTCVTIKFQLVCGT